ncbi:hypothetical protein EVAR_64452_1 [Eumeta japonica]|uniref:Uncharacterized protein n=1 Tax=Eumeta variegata TaxID=151549 RepID=A0A4C1ZLN6_EUMVA|nr:hypothetical protein EVAR_64452_1 [Eumeta japonica]
MEGRSGRRARVFGTHARRTACVGPRRARRLCRGVCDDLRTRTRGRLDGFGELASDPAAPRRGVRRGPLPGVNLKRLGSENLSSIESRTIETAMLLFDIDCGPCRSGRRYLVFFLSFSLQGEGDKKHNELPTHPRTWGASEFHGLQKSPKNIMVASAVS